MSHPQPPAKSTLEGCKLVVVQDHPQPCPYLDDTVARMPLQLPVGDVSGPVVDTLLQYGFRRSGDFVYKTECPNCNACQPTRVKVSEFALTKSLKRVLKRGERCLTTTWQDPSADPDRVDLFNVHRNQRNLGRDQERVSMDSYRSFLTDSCCNSRELSIYLKDELIAVSIIDLGEQSLSAVYTHFHPKHDKFSLGTYAILKQFEYAREMGLKYVYLGMYVAENRHLNYKARYLPQERLIDGIWTPTQTALTSETVLK